MTWVALARCDGDDIDLFSGCAKHKDEIEIKHEDCTCDAASALISNPASGQPTLNQIALLPTTVGGTISFNPTALPTATSSTSDSGSGGGLSNGSKIGIGVGVGLGVPIIAAIIFSIWFIRRKKTKQQRELQSEVSPQVAQREVLPTQQSPPPMYSPDFPNTQSGWQGFKPELHSDSAHKYELPSDTQGRDNNMNSIQNTPHDIYPPSELASDRTESLHSVPFISPQSTGSTDRPQPQHGGGGHTRTGSNMDPISEYHIDH
ncbi:hypothetical protein SLS62_007835 [Diatrype stigma]|uniref:Uncharacterized protein n=1 Tax=Diatrype stigma TaxID=117547 RepID=A0AAN9UM06_9PEZI